MIDGYVNAVERDSKVMHDRNGAFIERIKAGVFQRALERAKRTAYNVKVLLNHDYNRELTSTAEATTIINEDSIGLRCRCEIRDAEVVEKAKQGKLSGWSFGFMCLKDDSTTDDQNVRHRDVRELDLREVSILDDSKIPAYNGTSIEVRSEQFDDYIEVRLMSDELEIVDNSGPEEKPFNNYEWENRYMATRAN